MYLEIIIPLICLFVSWHFVRRAEHTWVMRPVTATEVLLNGIMSWLFLLSVLGWITGIGYRAYVLITEKHTENWWILSFASVLTAYIVNFYIRSRSELLLDDTIEFMKEALFFHRSAQRRLDVLTLLRERHARANPTVRNDPAELQRTRLQAQLHREKEKEQLSSRLRNGQTIDLSASWKQYLQQRAPNDMYNRIDEMRVDPKKQWLSILLNFPDVQDQTLHDDTQVVRLNRQIYELLQTLNTDPWLKPYTKFFKSYFLICRLHRTNNDGTPILFPFMKLGISIEDLQKLEGTYFNPRKLKEIATVVFKEGEEI